MIPFPTLNALTYSLYTLCVQMNPIRNRALLLFLPTGALVGEEDKRDAGTTEAESRGADAGEGQQGG